MVKSLFIGTCVTAYIDRSLLSPVKAKIEDFSKKLDL